MRHTDRLCDEGLALHLGGREGAQREGKPVTSPVGPTANDITRRARSQARQAIYGKGWRLGAAAPELFQMWLGGSLQLARWGRQGWAGGSGSRKAGRDSQLVGSGGLLEASLGVGAGVTGLLLLGVYPLLSTLALGEPLISAALPRGRPFTTQRPDGLRKGSLGISRDLHLCA